MRYAKIKYSGIRNKPWMLIEDFEIVLSNGATAIIPAGYWTDFASIPRPLKVFFDHLGLGQNAFLIHDYMYNFGGYLVKKKGIKRIDIQVSRQEADTEMYNQMVNAGESKFKSFLYYMAVRIGGWKSFRTV